MSNYLLNLARRSAGLVPVAHPRVGPGGGPDARLVRGVAQPTARPTSDPVAPATGAAGQLGEEAPLDAMVPRRLVTHDVTSRIREPEPRELEKPRMLRLVEPAAGSVLPDDAGSAVLPAARPVVLEATSPVDVRPAPVGRESDRSRDPELRRRRREASAGWPDGARETVMPRATVVESAVSPANLAGARIAAGPRGRGREVDVRIGTIEIHAEPAGAASPSAPSVAAPAPQGRPQGGFDDFVRLRTYAPWER